MFKSAQPRSNQIAPAGKEKIVLTQLSLAVAFITLAFSSCSTASSYRKLANSRITTVQMSNGDAIFAELKPGKYRTPESITEFTKKWYTLMLGWSGGETAVKVNGNLTIPANSYAAAQMMDTRLQKAFLTEFSQLIPSSIFAQDNQLKSSAKVRYVSDPMPLNGDTWAINVVADWILFDSATNSETKTVTFNKNITIKAAAIPAKPVVEEANSLQQLIESIRAYGLEIINLEEFEA
ncbi:MAG: hypothetical protein QNJ65_04055 [Xenococcaceae cyanobacterium MO_234.B1]|nr:hypothetical protein [Xenococcaceae cyanobacterium MO_234.B1]